MLFISAANRQTPVIVAYQTTPATAAKAATGEIPIVMVGAGDPVGTGLVASLARPGGNVTGLAGGAAEITGKTVELIPQLLPQVRRIAVIGNEVDPFTKTFLDQIRTAARALGAEVVAVLTRPGAPLAPVFEQMIAKRVDAVMTQPSLENPQSLQLALNHRLPSFSITRNGTAAGGLASYSANFDVMVGEAAVYVDRILKGSKPGALPVAFPSRFDLVINLKSAKALGITVPPALLALANEVIE